MTHFAGELWLADLPASKMVVDLRIVGDEVIITSDQGTIGHWPLHQVNASRGPDGYHLLVAGEELIFDTDSEELILVLSGQAATGVEINLVETPELTPPPVFTRPHARRRPPPPTPAEAEIPPPLPVPESPSPRPARYPLAALALTAGIAGLLLALVAFLSRVAVAAGTLAVILGLVSYRDQKQEQRGPGRDQAIAAVVLGGFALVIGTIVALS